MKFYIPVYDEKWNVIEIDTDKKIAGQKCFRTWKNPGYDRNIIYCGTVYNGENCFSTEKACWNWIGKGFEWNKYKIDISQL